jgi:photosystem II stability/assembly factor-like uncharacterized protein
MMRGGAAWAFLALWGVAFAQQPEAPTGPSPAVMAPKAAENRLLDVALAGTHLVAVGQQGVILVSEDGKSWKQAPSPVSVMLTRVRFTDERVGWALGYDATILQTSDGGQSWTLRHHDPEGRALYDVLFIDAQHGLAVGAYGTMLETTDGGGQWTALENALSGLGMHLNALLRLADGSLFAVGERGVMARSADAGASWAILDSPYAGSLFGALPQGEAGAVVYGMRGNVYRADNVASCPTVDAATWDPYARETATAADRLTALGWQKIESPITESLFGAVRLNDSAALLVGVNGTALRMDLNAASITPLKTPAEETLSKVIAFKGRLLAVGRRGAQDLGAAP